MRAASLPLVLILMIFLSLVFIAQDVQAIEMSSEDFIIYNDVIGSLGGNVTGSEMNTEFTAGQPTVDRSNDSEFVVYWGFWAPNEIENVTADIVVTPPGRDDAGVGGGGIGISYECQTNKDCNASQYCSNHKCYDAECFTDSDCKESEMCYEYACVVLFDIKILEFESPVKLGSFFDFTYLVKGVGFINDDVMLNYWIVNKDGEKITSGTDTIYMEGFIERIETSRLFLPSNAVSGVYEFYTEVVYKTYRAVSYRTIEIYVDEEIAQIVLPGEGIDLMQLLSIILLAIAVILSSITIIILKRRGVGTIPKKKIKLLQKEDSREIIEKIESTTAKSKRVHKKPRVVQKITRKGKRGIETPADFLRRIREKIRNINSGD